MDKIKIGLIGCGYISNTYFRNSKKFEIMDIAACADLVPERAKEKAKEYNIQKVYTLDEILADPDIDVILNLTTPAAHAEINLAALNAGKHIYSEKPLAVYLEDGERIIKTAKEKGLLVGCAPDTFLGGRLQTIRKIVDDGWIGKPVAASAFMVFHGQEYWHPDPGFYYKKGGGPMFDMGPYWLTALISLLGPVKRICGFANITFPQRIITSEPLRGQIIDVEVPTHITGALEFMNGAIVTMITSFDVWDSRMPPFELHGIEGSIGMFEDPTAGPSVFGGKIYLRRKEKTDYNYVSEVYPRPSTEWDTIIPVFGYNDDSRGIGLVDMCYAIKNKRQHRANGDVAYHVLEIMHGIHIAAKQGEYYQMKSTCKRPEPFQMGMPDYIITD